MIIKILTEYDEQSETFPLEHFFYHFLISIDNECN